jgi:NAD(P)-dependent dehydrogenase (short-subunit alcohol dehydrogenase family)
MTEILAGKTALILGEAGEVIQSLTRGLARRGAAVVTEAASNLVDLVIVAVTDPGGLAPARLDDMDEAEWVRRCEAPLRAARVALQAAYAALAGRGGPIFLLTPTLAMTGAAGFAPHSAAGEGARALAKSAARSWGAEGITVNCLALTAEQLCPGIEGAASAPGMSKALDRTPDLESDVAGFIAALAVAPGVVTGATMGLDGGIFMSV